MCMSNTRTDAPGRRGLIDIAGASHITKPGAGYDSTPWRTDVTHSGADSERSVMKDTETKLACFKLRAQGKSLATIADTVGVRRQTVANWLKEHEEEVENLKAIELDALREACWITTQARIERLSARLKHITAELDKRDFSDIPTAKLVEVEMKTRAELAREFAEPRIRSEQQLQNAKAEGTWFARTPKTPGGDTTVLLEPEKSGNGQKRSRHAD